MNTETEVILQDLAALKWFHAVGTPIAGDVTQTKNWSASAKYLGSHKWQKIKLAWRNELTEWLCVHHRQRFQEWNNLVVSLNPRVLPLVEAAVTAAITEEKVSKSIRDAIQWDILGLLLESEYSDLRKPKYYAALGLVYFDGHFPCGWDTNHHGGRMIVY